MSNVLYKKMSFSQMIDRKLSTVFLLSHFQSVPVDILDLLNMRIWQGDVYEIQVEFFSFDNMAKSNIYEVLGEVAEQMKNNRFLLPIELLCLNWMKPGLQFQHQIVTPRFSLGPTPQSIRETPQRQSCGQVLSLTESFDGFPIGPEIFFAMTTATDIDRGSFEELLAMMTSQPVEQSFA